MPVGCSSLPPHRLNSTLLSSEPNIMDLVAPGISLVSNLRLVSYLNVAGHNVVLLHWNMCNTCYKDILNYHSWA